MASIISEVGEKVVLISSYPPRRCGIAAFASDLIENVSLAGPEGVEPVVVAMKQKFFMTEPF